MNTVPYHTVGDLYEETRDLDIKDIAKLIRKDLRENWDKDTGIKFSVQIERYAGGRSINIIAKGTGFTVQQKFGEEGKRFINSINRITDRYNFDDSDSLSDYAHVRFYSHPRIES